MPSSKAFDEVMCLYRMFEGASGKESLIAEILERVGLLPASKYMDRFPHELSGGQRQRVLIARAVISRPNFIVADEPASALDVSVKASILNLLNNLKDDYNLGYIFITHDLPVVKKVPDYVYVMRHGAVVEHGHTRKIFENPETQYVRELIASAPEPDPILARDWLENLSV